MRRVRMTMMAATLTVAGWASAGAQAPLAADQTIWSTIHKRLSPISLSYRRAPVGLDPYSSLCLHRDDVFVIKSSPRMRAMQRSVDECIEEFRPLSLLNYDFYYNIELDYRDEILAVLAPGADGVPDDMPYEARLRRALAVAERLDAIEEMIADGCVRRPVIEMLPMPERAGLTAEEAATLNSTVAALGERVGFMEWTFISQSCVAALSGRVAEAVVAMRQAAGGPIPRPRPGSLLARTIAAMTELRRLTDLGWRMTRDARELCDSLLRRGPTLTRYRKPWVLEHWFDCTKSTRGLGRTVLFSGELRTDSFYRSLLTLLAPGEYLPPDLDYPTRLALLRRFLDDAEPVIGRISARCLDAPLPLKLHHLGDPSAEELARIAISDRPEGLFTQHELMTMDSECIIALTPVGGPDLLELPDLPKP